MRAKEVALRRWSCSFYLGCFAHALLANGQALLIDLRSLMDVKRSMCGSAAQRSMCGSVDQPQDALRDDRRRTIWERPQELLRGGTAQQLCFAS
jgi:hypothetical protein